MTEEWRDVPGYEGVYSVSNQGYVRREKSGPGARKGKILKNSRNVNTGHLSVTLWNNGKSIREYVHRIVASAFIPNPEGLPLVRHLNDVPTDNRVENLAWGTKRDNSIDAYRTGRQVLRTHCKRGHPLEPWNLRAEGGNRCKVCGLENARSRYAGRAFSTENTWALYQEQEEIWRAL